MVSGGLIAQALEGYDPESQATNVEAADAQRGELLERFPRAAWNRMPLEGYALGLEEHPDTFCRWMEFKAVNLGSIKGGSARKHHIYQRAEGGWWFEEDRYGSVEEAWEAVRRGFEAAIAIGEAGEWERADSISALRGGPALLAKTLHLYFPADVLPICSHARLVHFLRALGNQEGSLDSLGTISLNRLLLEGLRESGQLADWTTKEMERLLYTSEFRPGKGAAASGPIPDVAGFIASVVADYGNEAIEARRGAEDKARNLLDEATGLMDESQLRNLLQLFNADAVKGKRFKSRFSPAFVGATANGLVSNLGEVNVWTERLWRGSDDEMEKALSEMLGDHKLLPSAGTSFPTMLSHLRSAERFAVWLQPTDRGLQRLTPSYQPKTSPGTGELADYLSFCEAATRLMEDHEIPPELLDAVLVAASRTEVSKAPLSEQAAAWLFQIDPSSFEIDAAVAEEARLSLAVRQSRPRMSKGDRAYLWRSGPQAGLIAIGTLHDDPERRRDPPHDNYALDFEATSGHRVWVDIDSVLPAPVFRVELLEHPVLKDLEVIGSAASTNFELSPTQDASLRALLAELETLVIPEVRSEVADQLHLPHSFLRELVELLIEKRQAIFYGPPGTGKTRIALDLARELTREGGAVELVQFHPSYSYEDFVGGFRPLEEESATGVRFARQDGPLRRIARRASEDPGHPYVLLVDEINRGNIPKIFGELLFLLEYRRQSVRLQYWPDENFSLPENLFLIGTMNTADRSIALIDTALRRRFYFVEFSPLKPPIAQVLDRWLEHQGLDLEAARLLEHLNRAIGEDEFAVGPSYFINRDGSAPDLERIWEREIMPLMREHYFGVSWDETRYSLAGLRAARAALDQPNE